MDNIKQYENKNKKSKCLTRELTIDEKEKYNIGENKMNKELKIDNELRDLLTPLTQEEFDLLEENIKNKGCTSPLITWNDYIIDGHNRYNICKKNNISFEIIPLAFNTKEEVIIWMIDTQMGRRNLTDYMKFELKKRKAEILKEKGREKQQETLKQNTNSVLSIVDKTEEKHNTQQIIADELGWSTGKVAQADIVSKKASEEVKEKLRKGEVTINQAYKEIKKEKNTDNDIEVKEIKSKEVKVKDNKLKTCIKCNQEKKIDEFYTGHDKCKDCEQEEYEKRSKKSNHTNDSLDKTIKEVKTSRNVEDCLIIENEIECVEVSCNELYEQIESRFFTMLDTINKMDNEQINLAINVLDEHINNINKIKYMFNERIIK